MRIGCRSMIHCSGCRNNNTSKLGPYLLNSRWIFQDLLEIRAVFVWLSSLRNHWGSFTFLLPFNGDAGIEHSGCGFGQAN
jgi:hypothetical protein